MDLADLSPEDLRSFRLNEASLANARTDWPAARALIGRHIQRLRERGGVAPRHVDRCAELLEAGPDAMSDAFLSLTPEGQVLRSVHPFAGLLSPRERNGIIRATRRRRAAPPDGGPPP